MQKEKDKYIFGVVKVGALWHQPQGVALTSTAIRRICNERGVARVENYL